MIKSIIEVEIENIKVDNRYYSFDYKITIDGKVKARDSYDSDHSWSDDIRAFKEHLKTGGAVKLALENI